VVRGTH